MFKCLSADYLKIEHQLKHRVPYNVAAYFKDEYQIGKLSLAKE